MENKTSVFKPTGFIKCCKSKLVRNLAIAAVLLLSVFAMLLLDANNTLRDNYFPFLKGFDIASHDITNATWQIFILIFVAAAIILVGNIFQTLVINAVAGKDAKKGKKIAIGIIYYAIIAGIVAGVFFIFRALVPSMDSAAFNATKDGVVTDLLLVLLISLIPVAVLFAAIFAVYYICKLLGMLFNAEIDEKNASVYAPIGFIKCCKSKIIRNIVSALVLVLSVFAMLILDANNTIKKNYFSFLDGIKIADHDITNATWQIFILIFAALSILLVGNIFHNAIVNRCAGKDAAKGKKTAISVIYNVLLVAAAVGVFFILRAVLPNMDTETFNATKDGVFNDLLLVFLMSIIPIVALFAVIFAVYYIIKLIMILFTHKKADAEEAPAEAAEEPVAEEAPAEAAEEPVAEEDPEAPVITIPAPNPEKKFLRVSKSFTGKLCQSSEVVQSYYGAIKNHILGYKRATSRTSWGYDSFRLGRDTKVKITISGKTLEVYFALDPETYKESKYFINDVSKIRKYADTPVKLKIKSERSLKHAKELIDIVFEGIERKEKTPNVDYYLTYKNDKALVAMGWAKYTNSRF